jgi:hypothetical protein
MKKKLMFYLVLFTGMLSIFLIGCRKSTVVPVVTLKSLTNLTGTSAVTGGVVTNDGEINLLDCGVCWSILPNPTISDYKISYVPASANFWVTIQGLYANYTYFVRAYATNSAGTAYSEQSSFTTPITAPLISTADLTNVTDLTATGGGNIRSDGGVTITASGVCWSTHHYPTVADSKTIDGAGTGSFSSSITGLTAGTIYYIRAYATNNLGTGYGNEVIAHSAGPVINTIKAAAQSYPPGYTCTYSITNDGGSSVTARGVCISPYPNPTITDTKTIDGTGIGSFTSNFLSAQPVIIPDGRGFYHYTFYFRAYATNSFGTFYGNQVTYNVSGES